MLDISIITIGDELCIGQIVNTNSVWIAEQCTKLGANVCYHSIIRDNSKDLITELDRLRELSDIIMITGGLGPTHDDITKQTLTKYFNDELVIDKKTYDYLEQMLKKKGFDFSDRNQEQALLPSKCKLLPNLVGTAPGMLFEENQKYFISMPGVPNEMKYIMNHHAIPFIQKKIAERNDEIVLYKMLHTISITESKLADILGNPDVFLKNSSLAFLPSYKGVRLRIGVKADSFVEAQIEIKRIEKILYIKAGKYIYGMDDESLSSVIGQLLIKNKKTVSVAESCTAGLLAAEFTKNSGSSKYFVGGTIVYSNEIKEKVLNVKHETLLKFGAVSEETALELASIVRVQFGTDYGVSITGVAGPTGGTDEKPVGTVWIGIADAKGVFAKRFIFGNDRDTNRERSVATALSLLLKSLKEI